MMPSLFSAVSGLKGNQEMMDVIGNNIANVNTPGFKSSSVNFADLLSQTMKGASLPTSTTGGTNPIQIGQGTDVASVDTNFTNGSLQQTGNNTDLGVNGDGLFILGSGGNQYYTRDGDFGFDASGNLVSNANGMNVQGWLANSSGTISTSATPTNLSINLNASTPAQATSSMVLSGNLNSSLDNGTLLFPSGTGSFPFSVTNGETPPTTGSWQLSLSPAGAFNTWNWTITDASTGSTLDTGAMTLDSTTGKITNVTQSTGYTGTVGTSTSNQVVADNTSIIQGVNDNINLAVNGGAATSITIPPGSYATPADLVAAVNTGITNSTLSGSVTAALNNAGELTFTSTSGSNAVVVSAGANDASAQLGFYNGSITNGAATSVDLSAGLGGAGQTSLKLTVGNQTYDNVDLTALAQDAYTPGANTFMNNATTQATLQEAFNEKFGTGVVTVGISGNNLTLASNYGNVSVAAASNNGITGATFASNNNYSNNNDAGTGTFAIQMPAIGSLPNAFALGGSGSVTTAGGIPALTFTPPTANVIQTVYDALGNQYSANIAFVKNSVGSWNWSVQSITDSAGNTYTPSAGGTGSLQFSNTGSLPSGTVGTFSFKPTTGSVAPVSVSLNFSGLTQDDAANSAAVQTQNGYTSGTLQNYTIDQTGTITGSFSNGVTQALGQIALADFPNPGGLASTGSNLYTATANSGAITVQPAGTGSLGTIQTGSLEMSNVDLSQEMSNMIIAQSGFDANSKVITTDDQLLQTLVNMVQS